MLSFLFIKSDTFLNDYSRQAIDYLISQEDGSGIVFKEIGYGNARLAPLRTANWSDISAVIKLNSQSSFLAKTDFVLNIEKASLTLLDFGDGLFQLKAAGISLVNPDSAGTEDIDSLNSALERLDDAVFEMNFSVSLFDHDKAASDLTQIYNDLRYFIDEGKTTRRIDFTGISSFKINGEPVKARIFTEQGDGVSTLVMNKESIEIISWLLEEKLTDPEVELLSKKPFQAPKLLKIRDEAQKKSIDAHRENNVVPEDAYRHVLWSYLLTKEYGAELAEIVTNAHEQGAIDNTEAEHRMDYNNNAVGRKYALLGYRQEEILSRLLLDSSVVRKPR